MPNGDIEIDKYYNKRLLNLTFFIHKVGKYVIVIKQ